MHQTVERSGKGYMIIKLFVACFCTCNNDNKIMSKAYEQSMERRLESSFIIVTKHWFHIFFFDKPINLVNKRKLHIVTKCHEPQQNKFFENQTIMRFIIKERLSK